MGQFVKVMLDWPELFVDDINIHKYIPFSLAIILSLLGLLSSLISGVKERSAWWLSLLSLLALSSSIGEYGEAKAVGVVGSL